jgi:hypothetical protein
LDKEEIDKVKNKLLIDSREEDREKRTEKEELDKLRICSYSEDINISWYITVNKRKIFRLVTDIKLLEKIFLFEKVCFSYRRLIADYLGLYIK